MMRLLVMGKQDKLVHQGENKLMMSETVHHKSRMLLNAFETTKIHIFGALNDH